jgi:hypothetical protein
MLNSIKSAVKGANGFVCGDMSLLKFTCGKSTISGGNYLIPYILSIGTWIFSLITWFFLPLTLIITIPVIGILVVLLPPSLLVIGIAGIIILIVVIVANIAYFAYFFSQIGILSLLPTIATLIGWTISFFLGFIPYIGGTLGSGLNTIVILFPWMAIATFIHQRVYAA